MKRILPLAVLHCLLAASVFGAPARWTKVSSPYFTILTSDSISDAKEWAAGLEAMRLHLNELAPTDARLLEPMTLVIFDRLKTYEAVIPKSGPMKSGSTPLYRYTNRNGHFIGAVNVEDSHAAQFGIYMQGGMWLTNSYRRPLPLWLVTGLQGLYATSNQSDGRLTIGYEDEGTIFSLKNDRLIPLDQLLGMTTAGATYQNDSGRFNAQAWALVHYLMLGEKGANRPALTRFMNAILEGRSEAEAMQEAWPEGLEEVSKKFTRYVQKGVYRVTTLPMDLRRLVKEIHATPAPEADVQLALGYLHLYFQSPPAAAPYFERALALTSGAPGALEAMGELAEARDNKAESLRFYREAVAAGSKSYVAHYQAAFPAVQAIYGMEAAADHVDQMAARAAVDSMEEVLRLRPGFSAAHEALAGMAGALAVMTEEDAAFLTEGAERFPNDGRMAAGMVAYEIATKRYAPAKARIDRLYAGEFENTFRVQNYVKKLYVRLGAVNDLYWMERRAAEQNTAEATKFIRKLQTAPLLPAERERFAKLRAVLTTKGTLKRVEELIAQRNWSLANVLLDNLEADKPSDELKAEIIKLRERAQLEEKRALVEAAEK